MLSGLAGRRHWADIIVFVFVYLMPFHRNWSNLGFGHGGDNRQPTCVIDVIVLFIACVEENFSTLIPLYSWNTHSCPLEIGCCCVCVECLCRMCCVVCGSMDSMNDVDVRWQSYDIELDPHRRYGTYRSWFYYQWWSTLSLEYGCVSQWRDRWHKSPVSCGWIPLSHQYQSAKADA
jgi:hypothetical protein